MHVLRRSPSGDVPPSEEDPPLARTPISWPLTGRDAELAQARAAVAGGPGVVLVGPPGVGKSRLALAVAATFEGPGAAVAAIHASPTSTAVPLAPLSSLIGQASPHHAVAVVADALDEGHTAPGPPILSVDDAHLLDDASAAVIQQLVVGGRARVLLTVRSDEPVPPPIRSLWSSGDVEVIEVGPLAIDDVVDLLGAALGGPVEGRTAHQLARTSGGNALFLRELVEGSLDQGRLQERQGLWALRGEIARTPLVEDLIVERIGPLGPATRDLAELLSLSGPVGLPLLEELGLLAEAEALERAGVVQPVSGRPPTLDLAHPLYGEVLRDRLPATARLRLARRLAEAADAVGSDGAGGELRVVLWRRDGGLVTEPDRLLAAAVTASDAGDSRLAADLAVAAYDAGDDVEAALLASSSLGDLGEKERAFAVVEDAIGRASDPDDVGALRLRLVDELWWAHRDREGALAACCEAASLPDPWPLVFRAESGILAALEGRAGDALDACLDLVDHPHPMVARQAGIGAALGLLLVGRPAEGADVSARVAEATVGRLPSYSADIGVHVVTRAYCLAAQGDLGEARAMAELVYAAASAQPGRQARAWAAMTVGEVAMRSGDVDGAIRSFTEGELGWVEAGQEGMARWSAAALSIAQSLAGRAVDAEASLDRAIEYDARCFEMHDGRVERARAWVRFAAGYKTGAVDHLVALGTELGSGDGITIAAEAGRDLLWMGAPREAAALLGPLPENLLTGWWAELADAVVAGDGPALEALSIRFEGIGSLLDAAESSGWAARAHREAGANRNAVRCAARCAALAAACPGAATPILRLPDAATALSAREREVVALAATGLSNRAISNELFVSERTVANHLYRAFAKLGVTSREQLVDRLASPTR